MPRWIALATSLVSVSSQALAQTHTHPACGGEYHYRWAQKVDTSLQTATPEPVTVTEILRSWAPPAIIKADWCKGRTEPEQHVYVLTGWARFVKEEADDDGLDLGDLSGGPRRVGCKPGASVPARHNARGSNNPPPWDATAIS